jgi:hypothetical protein
MRIRLVFPVLLVLLVAACGGGGASSPAPSAIGKPLPTGQAAVTNEPAGGKVDCAKIKSAAAQLLMIQLLAQMRTPDTVEQIRTKQMGNLEVDAFLAGMHDLHALDAYTSPLGDAKAAITVYEGAGEAAKTLFGTDPITQAAIDTYNQKVGTIPEFLGHQTAIAGAMDAAGC